MTSTDALDKLAAALENACTQHPVNLETARALRLQVVTLLTGTAREVDISIARLTAVYVAINTATAGQRRKNRFFRSAAPF